MKLKEFNAKEYNVLIDTWWNVNVQGATALATATGFNRYMVECE